MNKPTFNSTRLRTFWAGALSMKRPLPAPTGAVCLRRRSSSVSMTCALASTSRQRPGDGTRYGRRSLPRDFVIASSRR